MPEKYNKQQNWETGQVITAEKMNAIKNSLTFTSEEIYNAVTGTIKSDEPDNDILSRKLDGMIKYFNTTPNKNELEYTRLYVLPHDEDIIVPKEEEYLKFKENFVSPFNRTKNYNTGEYIEYNDNVYKVIRNIIANTNITSDIQAWELITNQPKSVRKINIMQELNNLINVYSDTIPKPDQQNRIWIQKNSTEVKVPTYDQFNELKSIVENGKNIYKFDWIRHTLGGDGAWTDSTTRIATTKAYAFDGDVTVIFPSGMKGWVYYYFAENILSSNFIDRFGSDWVTGTFTFTPVSGRYYAFLAAYTNDDPINIDMANDIEISTVSIIGDMQKRLTSTESGTEYIKGTLDIIQVNPGDAIVDVNSGGFTIGAYIGQSNGTIEYSGNWILTDYTPVQPGKQYSYTGQLFTGAYIGYYSAEKNFVSAIKSSDTGSATSFTFTIPANVYYLRVSCHNPVVNNFSVKYMGIESYFMQKTGFVPSVELYVNDLYAVVGDTLQIFYDSVVYSNIDGVWVDISCAKGQKFERYWQYTPASADVGVYIVTFTVYDVNMKALLSKSVSLTVKAASNPSSPKKVLCIGDSMVADGQTPIELSRRLKGTAGTATSPAALLLSNYTLVGRVKNSAQTVGWEGTGGKTWAWYLSSESPFYYNGAINVEHYVNTYCGGSVDIVIILLGINDMALYSQDDNYDTLIANATALISAIHNALPDAKIILDGNVKRGGGPVAKFRHMTGLRLNKRYKALADSLSYVYFNESNAQFDSEYAYNTAAVPVNTRSEITYQHAEDFTHPGNTGWWQRADSWFRALINLA